MVNFPRKKVLFTIIIEDKLPIEHLSIKNLPESKMDLIARCILSIFPMYTYNFEPYFNVFFSKDELLLEVLELAKRNIPYDEIEIASIVIAKLNSFNKTNIQTTELVEGEINWRREGNFQTYLMNLKRNYNTIYYLHENGIAISKEISEMRAQNNICFILGGRKDISSENEKLMDNFGIKRISLGDTSYLSSTCIIFTLFELEKSQI